MASDHGGRVRRKGVGMVAGLAVLMAILAAVVIVVAITVVPSGGTGLPGAGGPTRAEGVRGQGSPGEAPRASGSPAPNNVIAHTPQTTGSTPASTREHPPEAPVMAIAPSPPVKEGAVLSMVDALLFKTEWRTAKPHDVEKWFSAQELTPRSSLDPLTSTESRRSWSAPSREVDGNVTVVLRARGKDGPWEFESAAIDVPWSSSLWESPESTFVTLFPVAPHEAASYEEAKVWKLAGGRSVWMQRLGEGEHRRMRIAMEGSDE